MRLLNIIVALHLLVISSMAKSQVIEAQFSSKLTALKAEFSDKKLKKVPKKKRYSFNKNKFVEQTNSFSELYEYNKVYHPNNMQVSKKIYSQEELKEFADEYKSDKIIILNSTDANKEKHYYYFFYKIDFLHNLDIPQRAKKW